MFGPSCRMRASVWFNLTISGHGPGVESERASDLRDTRQATRIRPPPKEVPPKPVRYRSTERHGHRARQADSCMDLGKAISPIGTVPLSRRTLALSRIASSRQPSILISWSQAPPIRWPRGMRRKAGLNEARRQRKTLTQQYHEANIRYRNRC